ncbi:hypothetical protein CC53_gp178 [Rhizobium phage vB_RleS_L338C]|uniref:hypothetical protein n=1 Tax=Rhizobium phage vB_RleS_L338C TaxID=1414737 RepID=UPI0003D874D4|nr:hypothetical protein CC53_gp178 [Rhizobium phage vB_RleS_L338C]AHC30595.1 hypothetical protein L338C_178 [Rhizobium phage vB_RleS_L338C]QNH72076.1 hypothetical protein P11VFA_140 [Rhizobium phage P11VFA]
MPDNADGISRAVEEKCGPTGLVSWYLMAGLMYYHFDNPILSDERFDQIGKTLLAAWDDIVHNHKHFVTKDELQAGSLFLKIEEFPMMTRGAANAVLTGLGKKLTPEQHGNLFFSDFVPPERIRNNPELYTYFTQGEVKKSWLDMQKERPVETPKAEEAPVVVRTRVRPSPASPVPEITVRTRTRPAPAPATPEIQVRTRVRPQ